MPVCIVCERDLGESEFYWRKDAGRLARDCKECKKRRAYDRFHHHARYERYGITRAEFEAQFELQGRCCALCRSPQSGGRGVWNIDHKHSPEDRRGKWRVTTGDTFRGILCHTCNVGLGQFERFLEKVTVERAVAYLGGRVNGLPRSRS